MVCLRLIDTHDLAPARGISHVRVTSRDLPFSDDALVIEGRRIWHREIGRARHRLARVGVECPKARAGRIVVAGVKSEAEQAAFASTRDESGRNIEERSREQRVIFHDADEAVLLRDEEAAVANGSEIVRRVQAAGNLLQLDADGPS